MGIRYWLLLFTALWGSGALAQMVVPTRVIRSQSLISAADLSVLAENRPGTFRDMDSVVGKEARVALYPGRPIRSGDVGEPAVVERNQIVRMNFVFGPLVISTEGRVLDRGGVGDRVRVMNLTSRVVVFGRVTLQREIEVN
jgi:flagellar basal body P-ring formation protein FlgA